MNKHPRRAALGALIVLAGCGGGEPTAPAPTLSELVLTPAVTSLAAVARATTLQVAAKDADGDPFPLPALTWSVNDPTVVSVDQAGKVTSLKDGSATVTVSSGSVSASATVHVAAAIDITAWVSFVANAALNAANDTAKVRVVVTDKP